MAKIYLYKYNENNPIDINETQLNKLDFEKFKKFKKKLNQRFFLFTRSKLYKVLTKEFGLNSIEFIIGTNGKLQLKDVNPEFDFSIAHHDEIFAVAISKNGKIGVDVESPTKLAYENFPLDLILNSVEISNFKKQNFLPDNLINDEAYVHFMLKKWVQKESFLKCLGLGISVNPLLVNALRSDRTDWLITPIDLRENNFVFFSSFEFSNLILGLSTLIKQDFEFIHNDLIANLSI